MSKQLTLRQAIALYPRLLDEPLLIADSNATSAIFQFSDSGYRTARIERVDPTPSSVWIRWNGGDVAQYDFATPGEVNAFLQGITEAAEASDALDFIQYDEDPDFDPSFDVSYREEGEKFMLFPNGPKGAGWIAKYLTTNVADTIYMDPKKGNAIILQMKDDGLVVKKAEAH